MNEVSIYSQEELLLELALVWFSGQFRPSLGRVFRQIVEEQPSEVVAQWLKQQVAKAGGDSYDRVQREIFEARRLGYSVLHYLSPDYPACLREIVDPPLVLFVHSQAVPDWSRLQSRDYWLSGDCIGIVGSRMCSAYGMNNARRLGRDIVTHGGVVISGLAAGVDQAAHEGALDAARSGRVSQSRLNCPTIAIIGSGLSHIYPRSNEGLAHSIVASGGAIVSEFGVSAEPRKHHFPQRNRLISALSDVVVVVEARRRSGALITARLALEHGKELLSVPGQIGEPFSEGTNDLIKQGAAPYTGIEDLLNPDRKWRSQKGPAKSVLDRGSESRDSSSDLSQISPFSQMPEECKVRETLAKQEEISLESLCERTSLRASSVSGILSILELDGIVEQRAPGVYRLIRSKAPFEM